MARVYACEGSTEARRILKRNKPKARVLGSCRNVLDKGVVGVGNPVAEDMTKRKSETSTSNQTRRQESE
jgi:hypothetical protein